MAITSGFFNSMNNDRKYSALQISELFDGLINDGIFATIGGAYSVTPSVNESTVNVSDGKAWFNHTWIKNDAILPVTIDPAEITLNRIDCIALEVNNNVSVTKGDVVYIKGTPASSPVNPVLSKTKLVKQYPLCYIFVRAGNNKINPEDITSCIGYDECPFVTGIIDVVDLDVLLGQWRGDLDSFVNSEKLLFDEWFNDIKNQLSTDAAGKLQNQIGTLSSLKTTFKKNLVGAINEVHDKEPVVLDSLEAINANTQSNRVAGALAVKTIASNYMEVVSFNADTGELITKSVKR